MFYSFDWFGWEVSRVRYVCVCWSILERTHRIVSCEDLCSLKRGNYSFCIRFNGATNQFSIGTMHCRWRKRSKRFDSPHRVNKSLSRKHIRWLWIIQLRACWREQELAVRNNNNMNWHERNTENIDENRLTIRGKYRLCLHRYSRYTVERNTVAQDVVCFLCVQIVSNGSKYFEIVTEMPWTTFGIMTDENCPVVVRFDSFSRSFIYSLPKSNRRARKTTAAQLNQSRLKRNDAKLLTHCCHCRDLHSVRNPK